MKRSITLGAIRWDAWYGHSEDEQEVVNQCERTLSPAGYHWRAPYFSRVLPDGSLRILPFTPERAEEELCLAQSAGIDYFAYVWYAEGPMTLARKAHLQTKTNVKLCCILDENALGNPRVQEEISGLLGNEKWMRTESGQPLIFFFARDFEKIQADIRIYREACRRQNLPAPFTASMVDDDPDQVKKAGCDAISEYSVWGRDGQSYESLADKAKASWEKALEADIQVIPSLAGGWDATPRYYTPVSWCENDAHAWAQEPDAKQLEEHVRQAFCWTKEHPQVTNAGTMILYAWNEHDEGGWICPTLLVDEQGAPITEGGKPLRNTERLDAVKKAISAMR